MPVQFDKLYRHDRASGSNKLHPQRIPVTRAVVPLGDRELEKFIVYKSDGSIDPAASVIKAIHASGGTPLDPRLRASYGTTGSTSENVLEKVRGWIPCEQY